MLQQCSATPPSAGVTMVSESGKTDSKQTNLQTGERRRWALQRMKMGGGHRGRRRGEDL